MLTVWCSWKLGSGTGLNNLIAYSTSPLDWAAGEIVPSDAQYNSTYDLQVLPFIGINVLVIYNIDGVTSSNSQLLLSRKLLTDIFSARVT